MRTKTTSASSLSTCRPIASTKMKTGKGHSALKLASTARTRKKTSICKFREKTRPFCQIPPAKTNGRVSSQRASFPLVETATTWKRNKNEGRDEASSQSTEPSEKLEKKRIIRLCISARKRLFWRCKKKMAQISANE